MINQMKKLMKQMIYNYSPYKKLKLDEEEDTASTIVAVTASITSVISRTKKRAPRQPNLIRNKEWQDRCYRDFASEEFKLQVRIHDFEHS